MGAELPLLSAVMARMLNPEINLAAYGGVVFPLALLIESPIIMLLAASTALSHDLPSYRKLWRFMMVAGGSLTLVHATVAFTPLFDIVARDLIGAPEEIIGPARVGMMMMTPWTWAIAHRRFNQGVLIRFGRSHAVATGTLIRLLMDVTILGTGYTLAVHFGAQITGVMVATAAVSAGVLGEAFYVWLKVHPVIHVSMPKESSSKPPLNRKRFLRFYLPLAASPLLGLAAQPVITAGISRMPLAIESLAVWPALNGLVFMVRSLGLACLEIVVAMAGKPDGYNALRIFARNLMTVLLGINLIILTTSFSGLWFGTFNALDAALVSLALPAMWASITQAPVGVVNSFCQGILVHAHQTRGVTEAVGLFLLTCTLGLGIGIATQAVTGGALSACLAISTAQAVQLGWLLFRSRSARRKLGQPD